MCVFEDRNGYVLAFSVAFAVIQNTNVVVATFSDFTRHF